MSFRMNHRTQPTDPDETLSRLLAILQALAASGERQKALFPDSVFLGDELALEFDARYHALVTHGYDKTLPVEALALLAEIDGVFDRMVNAREHAWSAEAVAEREEWSKMRRLADQALETLGWPQEGSPTDTVREA
jgi:hypothetical protein